MTKKKTKPDKPKKKTKIVRGYQPDGPETPPKNLPEDSSGQSDVTNENGTNGTPIKKRRFLDAYSNIELDSYLNIGRACKVAGIGRRTHYNWIKDDPDYNDTFHSVEESAIDDLEMEAYWRGKDKSDVLLIFLLKSRRKKIYGDKQELNINDNRPLKELTPEEAESISKELTDEYLQ